MHLSTLPHIVKMVTLWDRIHQCNRQPFVKIHILNQNQESIIQIIFLGILIVE